MARKSLSIVLNRRNIRLTIIEQSEGSSHPVDGPRDLHPGVEGLVHRLDLTLLLLGQSVLVV